MHGSSSLFLPPVLSGSSSVPHKLLRPQVSDLNVRREGCRASTTKMPQRLLTNEQRELIEPMRFVARGWQSSNRTCDPSVVLKLKASCMQRRTIPWWSHNVTHRTSRAKLTPSEWPNSCQQTRVLPAVWRTAMDPHSELRRKRSMVTLSCGSK